MRLKHNKKRNTAFVYEALIRELTESVVKHNKNKQNKIVSIIREHFGKDSVLNEELGLYQSIYETKHIEKNLAEKIVVEAKQRYSDLDKKTIFKEQSVLINKINKGLSRKIFNNFVPNYKNIASVYSIFQEKLPVRDRVLLEENIVNQMSSSAEKVEEEAQLPVDSIVYSTFVKKFNEEYAESLNEDQKSLLSKYVTSFADNGIEFRIFLNEELGKLKEKLLNSKKKPVVSGNNDLGEKIDSVHGLLESWKNKDTSVELVELILKTQMLLEEIESNDNIG